MPLKVLHIIPGLPTGGAERMLVSILAASNRERFSHYVVSLMDKGTQGDRIEELGIPLHALYMSPGCPSILGWMRLRNLVGMIQPNVIHGWMYNGAIASLCALSGQPVIAGIHHSLDDISNEKRTTRLAIHVLRMVSDKPERVLYCSQTSRSQHEEIGFSSTNGSVIPNGFDCERFGPDEHGGMLKRKELGIPNGAFVVGHIARHHPVKDHETCLHAAGRLINMYAHVHFIMVGDNVTTSNLELGNAVAELDLDGNVHMLGERQDIPELLNSCDLLISSSRAEAFPIVLGEAMACAVPCVATDVGDSRYIIGDSGAVVPKEDDRALAESVAQFLLMDSETLSRRGKRARERIVSKFSLESVVRAHEELYTLAAHGRM